MKVGIDQLPMYLQKHPSQAYVLSGPDALLIQEAAELIVSRWEKSSEEVLERKIVWIESPADWARLYEPIQHFSLFHSLVLLDVRFSKKVLDSEGLAFLKTYTSLSSLPCFLLLQAPLLQAKQITSFPPLSLLEIPSLKGAALKAYIANKLKQAGLSYREDIPSDIATLAEGNLIAIHQCIQHLRLLNLETIHHDTISLVLSHSAQFPLYALNEVCLVGDPERILRVLQSLKFSQTPPLLLGWTLTTLVRQLQLLQSGIKGFQALNIFSSQQPLYQKTLKRLSSQQLNDLLRACRQLELLIKQYHTDGIWNMIQQIALSFCVVPFFLSPDTGNIR